MQHGGNISDSIMQLSYKPAQPTDTSTIIELSTTDDGGTGDNTERPKMSPFLEACFAEYYLTLLADIGMAENPIMMIEPIVWYRPVTTAGVVAPYYVCDTAPNIAEYSIKFAGNLGNENGANMSTLTHATLPNSMTIEVENDFLGLSSAPMSKYYTSKRILGIN